jgi:hypothetical protein
MIWLGPGEARAYHTTFTILDGAADLTTAAQTIEARQKQPTADVPG